MCVVQQEKPKQIDPLDYEAVICELLVDLQEDPLRDLLLFPDNDFSVSVCVCVEAVQRDRCIRSKPIRYCMLATTTSLIYNRCPLRCDHKTLLCRMSGSARENASLVLQCVIPFRLSV